MGIHNYQFKTEDSVGQANNRYIDPNPSGIIIEN